MTDDRGQKADTSRMGEIIEVEIGKLEYEYTVAIALLVS
jgi:hypothetical protein